MIFEAYLFYETKPGMCLGEGRAYLGEGTKQGSVQVIRHQMRPMHLQSSLYVSRHTKQPVMNLSKAKCQPCAD